MFHNSDHTAEPMQCAHGWTYVAMIRLDPRERPAPCGGRLTGIFYCWEIVLLEIFDCTNDVGISCKTVQGYLVWAL